MITWPPSLISEIAERRCIIFLGAGASHTSVSKDGTQKPPLWNDFLRKLLDAMHDTGKIAIVKELIAKENYLDAAEIIRTDVNKPDYNLLIWNIFHTPEYKPSLLHELIRDLDVKTVITTNYDKIYESCCDNGGSGYNTCAFYQGHLVNDLKSNKRLVIKAHGCVSDAAKTILTRSDYFNARRDYGNFYHILDSLFVTNTLLFIGYSLGDPDIRLILENVNIATQSICPHYAVVEEGMHDALKTSMKMSYNVQLLEHSTGKYTDIIDALKKLLQDVEVYRETHP